MAVKQTHYFIIIVDFLHPSLQHHEFQPLSGCLYLPRCGKIGADMPQESAMVSVAFSCLLLWINSCIVEAERSLIVFKYRTNQTNFTVCLYINIRVYTHIYIYECMYAM